MTDVDALRAPGATIVWFRRDLRLADHPALSAAVAGGGRVVPLFVLDPRLLDEARAAPARSWFVLRSVAALDSDLRARGSGLLLRAGRAEDVVPLVAHEVGAATVLATRDVTPFSHRRDAGVSAALEQDGRRLKLLPGLLLAEPETLLASSERPYGVFTPFWRSLRRAPRRAVLAAVERVESPPGLASEAGSAALRSMLKNDDAPLPGLPRPGAAEAEAQLMSWVRDGLTSYAERRNDLDGAATSHLSAALHAGTLSPLQVETASLELGDAADAFVRQLAWREFYQHRLFHGRRSEGDLEDPLMAVFRQEGDDPVAVAAWRDGRTGIPAVDAGMRQLAATGWLGNRARLVVASFLTRHLLMHPGIGERHFMRHLVDGDVANNRGGWQWTAGVGADPQPWFRVFNPVLQGQRFDPEGDWVRRWLPELEHVPREYLHAPWEMPEEILRAAGVRLGETYPRPIVDLRAARDRALAAFRAATEASAPSTGRRQQRSMAGSG